MNNYPIAFTDLPKWAIEITHEILGQSKRPNAYVTAQELPLVGGTFHDSQKLTLIARNEYGKLSFVSGTFGGVNPFATAKQNAVNNGVKMTIPPNCQVLEISQGIIESVTLFVNPIDCPKYLVAESLNLTDVQKNVLNLIGGLTSAGRLDAIKRYHIPTWFFQDIVKELAELELLAINRAGAIQITLKGKQVRNAFGQNMYSDSFWYKWEDCFKYDYNTSKMIATDFARDILIEYKTKYHAGQ